MYQVKYITMPKPRGCKPFRWNHWSFTYPPSVPYKHTSIKVCHDHLKIEEKTKRICRQRCMQGTTDVDGPITSIRCQISLPPQVQIVHIYLRRINWIGRYLRHTQACFATACNLKTQKMWPFQGYFFYSNH